MMIKRITFLVFMLLSLASQADVKEFTREYTYSASENDSKVSARKAALVQLQSLVIQEVGVQVQSSFSNQETLDGDDFSRKVQANHETFAQALTKTKILKEQWNGETFYIKAKITVDTDNLVEKIKTVYVQVGSGGGSAKAEDVCKSRHNKAIDLLNEVRGHNTIQEIIELSKAHEFDRGCNSWQFSIISDFASLRTDSDEYRAHLFHSIKNMESDAMAGELMVATLRYALRIKPISDREWDVVRDAIFRGKQSATRSLVSLLIEHTKKNDPDASDREKEYDTRRQTKLALEQKLSTLTGLGAQLSLSFDDPLSEVDVVYTILQKAMNNQPDIALDYFMDYRSKFSQQQLSSLSSSIFNRFRQHPTDDMYHFFNNYINVAEIDQRISSGAFQLFVKFKKNRNNDPRYTKHLEQFMKWNKKEAALIIEGARTNDHERKLWFIEYDIPSDKACKVKECAKGLFSKKKRDMENAADYLLAYGSRAAPATDQVLKKLERIKALKKVGNDTRLIPKLIRILDNVGANTDKTYELLVWAIGDVSKAINEQASSSLQKAGSKALPVLVRLFPSQKVTPQRRIIDVMGTYKSQKAQTLEFLSSVKPATPQMRFAIEDATEALKR